MWGHARAEQLRCRGQPREFGNSREVRSYTVRAISEHFWAPDFAQDKMTAYSNFKMAGTGILNHSLVF